MAWALVFDGVNDWIQFDSVVDVGIDDFCVRIKFDYNGNANETLIGTAANNNNVIRISTASAILFKIGSNSENIALITPLSEGVNILRFKRESGVLDITDDSDNSLTLTNPVSAGVFQMFGFGTIASANSLFSSWLEYIQYYSDASATTLVNNWDATSSNHGVGTPILSDIVAFNDASGVNMPTDGSAWLNLGGDPVFPDDFTGLARLTIDKTEVTGDHDNFTGVFTEKDLGSFTDHFFANIQDGGGDIRLSTDKQGASRIALNVILCDKSAKKVIVQYIVSGVSATTTRAIFIWGANSSASQPAINDTFGSNAVYTANYAYYPMQATGTQTDSTGNGNDLAATGTFTTRAGQTGNELVLSGTEYLDSDNNVRGNTSFTLFFVIKTAGNTQWIYDDGQGVNGGTQVLINAAGTMRCRIDDSGSNNAIFDTVNIVNSNTHRLGALVIDKTAGLGTFYIDGSASGTPADISALGDITPTLNPRWGGSDNVNDLKGLVGGLSYCHIANTAKSADYIATFYNSQRNDSNFYTVSEFYNTSNAAFTLGQLDVAGVVDNTAVNNSIAGAFALGQLEVAAAITQTPSTNTSAVAFSLGQLDVAGVVNNTPSTNTSEVAFTLGQLDVAGVVDNTEPNANTSAVAFSIGRLDVAGVINNGTTNASAVAFTLGQLEFSSRVFNGDLVPVFTPKNAVIQPTFSRQVIQDD